MQQIKVRSIKIYFKKFNIVLVCIACQSYRNLSNKMHFQHKIGKDVNNWKHIFFNDLKLVN